MGNSALLRDSHPKWQSEAAPARIMFDSPHSPLICTIRERSDQGATLVVMCTIALPDIFQLVSELEEPRQVEISWRGVTEVGVIYSNASAKPDAGQV